jgi:hypothetical protein
MLDVLVVVNSPVESPRCVHTQNEQEPETPTRNMANRTVWFDKSNGPISSAPVAVRGV